MAENSSSASFTAASMAVFTKAVVAICVVLVPEAAVGDVGVPVNVGEANAALAFNAVIMAVDTGLSASAVLLTFPKPTFEALIPVAIFESLIAPSNIFAVVIALAAMLGEVADPLRSPAN